MYKLHLTNEVYTQRWHSFKNEENNEIYNSNRSDFSS